MKEIGSYSVEILRECNVFTIENVYFLAKSGKNG